MDLLNFPFVPFPEEPVPEVWLSGKDYLCWRPGGTKRAPSLDRMLYEFMSLAGSDSVLRFAQKYGPLGLCKHGMPAMAHKRNRVLCPPYYQKTRAGLHIRERVSDILVWAARADALYRIAVKTQNGEPISGAEWQRAGLGGHRQVSLATGEFSELPLPSGGIEAKRLLSGIVNIWLRYGDPRPYLLLDASGRLELKFRSGDQSIGGFPSELDTAAAQIGSNPNLAVLSMQLATAVAGGAGLTTCSACGTLYSPKRTPVPGRRHFCTQCGKRAAYRLSKRAKREKRQEQ